MKKWFCIFLLFSVFSANAGDPAKGGAGFSWAGKVLDESNAEALVGASVKIRELGVTAFAGFDGTFEFENLAPGTYTLEISYISYRDKVVESFPIEPSNGVSKIFLSSL